MRNDNISRLQRTLQVPLWVASPASLFYLTGVPEPDLRLLVAARQAYAVVDARFRVAGAGVREVQRHESAKVLRQLAQRTPKLQVEGGLGYFEAQRLRKLGFHLQLGKGDDPVQHRRLIKERAEVRSLQRAADITVAAYPRVRRWLRVGVSELKTAHRLKRVLLELGADGLAFPPIVAFGANSAIPHHFPTSRRLRNGDLVLLDFGAVAQGYHADMTRTFVYGQANTRQRQLIAQVQEAQRIGLQHYRAGQPIRAADVAVRAFFRQHKVERYYPHSLGHGLGLEIHEAPSISVHTPATAFFRPGMAVTAEPGLSIPGFGGARWEDDVIITKNSCRLLTK